LKAVPRFRPAALVTAAILVPAASFAQPAAPVSPSGPVPGITVVGRATVSVPPDRMRVTVRLFPRNVTGQQLEAMADEVATAMRSGGIADAKTALPLSGYLGANSTIAIVGTIVKPTRGSLETTVRSALAAVPDATATALANAYQVTTTYAVDDCSAAETRAQTAAIDDARARAGRVAVAAGLRLGSIVSVNETSTYAQPACNPDFDEPSAGPGNTDPYGPVVVPIAVNAIVTFAVR
jgi:uncharacterized protein